MRRKPPFSVLGFIPIEFLHEYGELDDTIPEEADRLAELEDLARDTYDALLAKGLHDDPKR